MYQLTLFNSKTYDLLNAEGGTAYYQGVQRDSICFELDPAAYSLDELAADLTPKATRRLTITQDDSEYIHEHYTLRQELALRDKLIQPETPEAPAQTEPRIFVTLAQATYGEVLAEQTARTAELTAAALEEFMAFQLGGGETA